MKLSEGIVITTVDESATCNDSNNLSFLSPCNHEETDTKMMLHAKDASLNGLDKDMIKTVDIDVIVITIAMFASLELSEHSGF